MRAYILFCLVAVAIAAPQYNYQQTQGHFAGQQSSFAQQFGFGQAQQLFGGTVHSQRAPTQVIYNKQFFIHSAPEDEILSGSSSSGENSVIKKNLRVVIVKAPDNRGLTNAALQLAKSSSDDKTVVYVLNKQTDLGELQNQLSQLQESNPNKPEVHFVKYKTSEEAKHAQHSIQSQYDSFGGPTQVVDEGVAPVESFIGSLGGGGGGSLVVGSTQFGSQGTFGSGSQGTFSSGSQGTFGSVSNAYLPSVRLY